MLKTFKKIFNFSKKNNNEMQLEQKEIESLNKEIKSLNKKLHLLYKKRNELDDIIHYNKSQKKLQNKEIIKFHKLISSYRVSNSDKDIWTVFDSVNDKARIAWKIHIYSRDSFDYINIYKEIIPYLIKMKIYHKTIKSIKYLDINLRQDNIQHGKAFTIYPSSIEQFQNIAKEISKIIREKNLTTNNSSIQGDKKLGITGRLFYRYELKKNRLDKGENDNCNLPSLLGKTEMKDIIFKNDTVLEKKFFRCLYDDNRGKDRYLAADMTENDDIFTHFNPDQ